MENDIEQARASNMEEDKASTPNKGKDIDVGNASDIEMAKDILQTLYIDDMGQMPLQQNCSGSCISECCIYRVPKLLRNVNLEAYVPLRISIGPLHRQNKRLEAMEREKETYFIQFTKWYGMDEKKMCDIVISIKNQEERLRNCYSEKFILIESCDFVRMILLDAVFIILFFLDEGPKIFEYRMTLDIREDLMLLENQLPLFIIQEIYDQINPCSQDAKAIPFLDLITCHFGKYLSSETKPSVEGSKHFTDLLRNLMLKGFIEPFDPVDLSNPPVLKYSAVMLRKAGVRFKVTRDKRLVNIKFEKGVLKIPQLDVDHNFERLVRNIMAMEQCLYEREAYICSYIKFMDHLIDSAEDVGFLVRKGIIVHRLGDDAAVSNMIKDLSANINNIKYTCFGHISKGLNAHFDSPFNNAIATLVLGYFPDIWRGTATVAAAILLILTFIQTLSSLKLFG